MIAVLDSATSWGRHQADRLAGQGSIFDLGGEEESRPPQHPPVPAVELDKKELLRDGEGDTRRLRPSIRSQAVREPARRKTDCRSPRRSGAATARSYRRRHRRRGQAADDEEGRADGLHRASTTSPARSRSSSSTRSTGRRASCSGSTACSS